MSSAIARAAVAPVLAGPSVRAEQVTQLILGESAAIMERSGDWRRVCIHIDGYNGWIHAGYLLEVEDAKVREWRARANGWSKGAIIRAGDASVALPLRARVVLQNDSVVLPDRRQGKVVDGGVQELKQVIAGARAEAPEHWALEHFAGTPYQWGGVTPWGVDCSGLVQTTFAARGVDLPRDSAQQAACGENVTPGAIRPGDLLFFRGESGQGITHVAFAGEADTLVHATLACGGTLSESWLPGTRAASLRDRLAVVRRLEER
jgi:gamma-D-glutamyl-L-lysine dipeptidyl-peptidase